MNDRSPAGLVSRGLRHPGAATSALLALAAGWWYKFWYGWIRGRLRAGRNLRVQGSLSVRGPGRVIFGHNVTIGMRVTPWTYAPEAVITIGDRVFLNGTSFGCAREITIGADCILADAAVMDTNFHSVHVNRHDPDAPVRVKPVRLEPNVWVGSRAGLLPGTTIGANSVVGFGAVCAGAYPGNSIIGGNPAQVIRPVPGPEADPGDLD